MLQLYADNGFKFNMINFMTMYYSTLIDSSLQTTIQQSYQAGVSQSTSKGFSTRFGFTMCTGFCGKSPNTPVNPAVVTNVMNFAAGQSTLAMVSIWSTNNEVANGFGSIAAMFKGTASDLAKPAGYQGCFADTYARTLPTRLYSGPGNTIENCKTLCASAGFTLAGLQWGQECFCGNVIPPTKLAEGSCSMVCSGNANQICGNGLTNSVFLSR